MKQNEKNSQKDQELTKEELEQVNGGGFPRPKPLWRPTDVLIAADFAMSIRTNDILETRNS